MFLVVFSLLLWVRRLFSKHSQGDKTRMTLIVGQFGHTFYDLSFDNKRKSFVPPAWLLGLVILDPLSLLLWLLFKACVEGHKRVNPTSVSRCVCLLFSHECSPSLKDLCWENRYLSGTHTMITRSERGKTAWREYNNIRDNTSGSKL